MSLAFDLPTLVSKIRYFIPSGSSLSWFNGVDWDGHKVHSKLLQLISSLRYISYTKIENYVWKYSRRNYSVHFNKKILYCINIISCTCTIWSTFPLLVRLEYLLHTLESSISPLQFRHKYSLVWSGFYQLAQHCNLG